MGLPRSGGGRRNATRRARPVEAGGTAGRSEAEEPGRSEAKGGLQSAGPRPDGRAGHRHDGGKARQSTSLRSSGLSGALRGRSPRRRGTARPDGLAVRGRLSPFPFGAGQPARSKCPKTPRHCEAPTGVYPIEKLKKTFRRRCLRQVRPSTCSRSADRRSSVPCHWGPDRWAHRRPSRRFPNHR